MPELGIVSRVYPTYDEFNLRNSGKPEFRWHPRLAAEQAPNLMDSDGAENPKARRASATPDTSPDIPRAPLCPPVAPRPWSRSTWPTAAPGSSARRDRSPTATTSAAA